MHTSAFARKRRYHVCVCMYVREREGESFVAHCSTGRIFYCQCPTQTEEIGRMSIDTLIFRDLDEIANTNVFPDVAISLGHRCNESTTLDFTTVTLDAFRMVVCFYEIDDSYDTRIVQ